MNINDEFQPLFNWARLPARLTADDAAIILSYTRKNLQLLERKKLLLPLGKVNKWTERWYSTAELMRKSEDTAWLHKAQAAIQAHNKKHEKDEEGEE
jgi:hypothetical protein